MRIGGYFPLLTGKQKKEMRINSGFMDDIGDAISSAFGGGGDANDGDGLSAGGRGSNIAERNASDFERRVGTTIGGMLGGPLGSLGMGGLIDSNPHQIDLNTGEVIRGDQGEAEIGSSGGNNRGDIQTLFGGGQVPVMTNAAGQLVDAAGNLVNQQGQQVDASGRAMSDSDIAIQKALGFTDSANSLAVDEIKRGQGEAVRAFNDSKYNALQSIQGGLDQGNSSLRDNAAAAQGFLSSGAADAQGYLQTQADRGIGGIRDQLAITQGRLDPYTQAGNRALATTEDFLGQSGVEAQQNAFDNFTESPGQAFFREQQEQARLRNSAATGGLGGGRVQMALQDDAFGRASTRLDNQLNRLSELSGRGQQSATQQGQFGQAAESDISQLLAQLGGRQSDVSTSTAARQAGVSSNLGAGLAALAETAAGRQANTQSQFGRDLANSTANSYSSLANLAQGAGQDRSSAVLGQQIANSTAQTEANRLAAMQQQQSAQQDSDFQNQLLGLGGDIFGKQIASGVGNLFGGLF